MSIEDQVARKTKKCKGEQVVFSEDCQDLQNPGAVKAAFHGLVKQGNLLLS